MIRRIAAAALGAYLAIACAASARAQTPPISPLAWLVGGTWVAQGDDMPPGVLRIETQYRWAATGNFIQFTTQFVGKDGKPNGNYAGNFYYDPATKELAMWYMDRENVITKGPVGTSPMGASMYFTQDGSSMGVAGPVDYEVALSKESDDAYRWTLAARKAGSSDRYKPLFMLEYARKAP